MYITLIEGQWYVIDQGVKTAITAQQAQRLAEEDNVPEK